MRRIYLTAGEPSSGSCAISVRTFRQLANRPAVGIMVRCSSDAPQQWPLGEVTGGTPAVAAGLYGMAAAHDRLTG